MKKENVQKCSWVFCLVARGYYCWDREVEAGVFSVGRESLGESWVSGAVW